jgi:hypothetical protein
MDRCVVDALLTLPESRRFMKGLFAWVGFRTTHVDYERPERVAGQSKFNGWRLWNFALEGITSFSTEPLRIWTYIGAAVSLVSFAFAIFIVVRTLIHGVDMPGYASLMVAVTFLGGLQLIGIGVLGSTWGALTSNPNAGRFFWCVASMTPRTDTWIKETDILGDSIGEHWYYCSKAAATRRLLGEAPITRILDVGAGSGFFASSVDPNLGAGGVVRRYQLPRRF